MTRSHRSGKGAPKGPSQRQLRVGELVRHVVSDLLTRGEVMDPELEKQLITVAEVRMSPDLKLATAYVLPMGDVDKKTILDALNRHQKFFRGVIGHRVDLRFAPAIRFRLDDRFEDDMRIDRLLHSPAVARDLAHDDETDSDDAKPDENSGDAQD